MTIYGTQSWGEHGIPVMKLNAYSNFMKVLISGSCLLSKVSCSFLGSDFAVHNFYLGGYPDFSLHRIYVACPREPVILHNSTLMYQDPQYDMSLFGQAPANVYFH